MYKDKTKKKDKENNYQDVLEVKSRLLESNVESDPFNTINDQDHDTEEIDSLKKKIDLLQNQINSISKKEPSKNLVSPDKSSKRYNDPSPTGVKHLKDLTPKNMNSVNLERTLRDLEDENALLKFKNNQMQYDLNQAKMDKGDVKPLRKNLDSAKKMNDRLMSVVKAREGENLQLKNKIHDLENRLKDSKKKNNQLERRVRELEKENREKSYGVGETFGRPSVHNEDNYRLKQTNLCLLNLLTDNYKSSKDLFNDNRMPEESKVAGRLIEYIQELKKNPNKVNKGLTEDNTSLIKRDHDIIVDGMQNLRKTVRGTPSQNKYSQPVVTDVENDPKYKELKKKYNDLLHSKPKLYKSIIPGTNHPYSSTNQIKPGRRLVSISPQNLKNYRPSAGNHPNIYSSRRVSPAPGEHQSIPTTYPSIVISPDKSNPVSPSNPNIIKRGMPVSNRDRNSLSPYQKYPPHVSAFTPSRSPVRQNITQPRQSYPRTIEPRTITVPQELPRSSASKKNNIPSAKNQVPNFNFEPSGIKKPQKPLRRSSHRREPSVSRLNPLDLDRSLSPAEPNLMLRGKPIPNKERNRILIDGSPTMTLKKDNSQGNLWSRAMGK